jgi:hypothetical protein
MISSVGEMETAEEIGRGTTEDMVFPFKMAMVT